MTYQWFYRNGRYDISSSLPSNSVRYKRNAVFDAVQKKEKQSCWVCSVFLGFCCCISDRLVAQFETKPIRSAASVDVFLVFMVRRLLHRSNPKAGKI